MVSSFKSFRYNMCKLALNFLRVQMNTDPFFIKTANSSFFKKHVEPNGYEIINAPWNFRFFRDAFFTRIKFVHYFYGINFQVIHLPKKPFQLIIYFHRHPEPVQYFGIIDFCCSQSSLLVRQLFLKRHKRHIRHFEA